MDRRMRAQAARSIVLAGVALAAATAASVGFASAARAAGGGDVVLEHLSFHRGRVTVEVPRVEAHGTPLTADGLREILDPSTPLDLGQRLTRLSAASLAAPDVTLRRDAEPNGTPPQAVTFHDVLLTDVQAGKTAALTIRSADGAIATGDGEIDKISVGALAAHALDPQLMLQIATGSRTDKDLPVSPMVHDLAIDGLRLASDKAQVIEVGRFETGAIGGRPFRDTPAHLLRRLEEKPGGFKPDPTDPLYQDLIDAALSLRLERLRLSRGGFSAPDGTGFRIATVLLDSAGPGSLPLFEVDDAGLDAEGVHLSMKSAVLSGSGSAAVFTRVATLLTGQASAADAVPVAADARGAVDFKVSDIHMVLPPADGGPFPPGTVNTVDVPSFVFGESAAAGGATAEAHQQVEVRYDIPSGGSDPTIQNMRDLGLSHLDVTFGYRVSYDSAGHAIRLDELALSAKGIGSATATARMGDVPDEPFRPGLSGDELAEHFADATVRDVTVALVDEGFMARALPMLARQSGTSPEAMRAGLKTQVDLALPNLLGQTPAAAAVARAIDGFIDAGGTLTLAARSPKGVSLGEITDLADPSEMLRLFDVTAVGTR